MPKASEAETVAFLTSIDSRLVALDDVEGSCPFDPMAIANTFIAKMQTHSNITQIVHTYADAMMAIEPGARKAWEKFNSEVEAVSWPYGLAGIQRMAAEINRKAGNMPANRVE